MQSVWFWCMGVFGFCLLIQRCSLTFVVFSLVQAVDSDFRFGVLVYKFNCFLLLLVCLVYSNDPDCFGYFNKNI